MTDERAEESTQRGDGRRKHRASRKKRAFLWITLLILLVAAVIGAKPGYHWLKARRAEQFAAEGGELFKQGKWNEAAEKYRAALQLNPLGYPGLEGAARLASRADRPEAAYLWEQVFKSPQCTDADRQEYAALLLKLKRLDVAGKIIDQLLKANPDTKTLTLASRYAEQTGESGKALEFAKVAMNRAPDDDAARSRMAELLAASPDSTQQAEARRILWELVGKEGPNKRLALQVLARAPELSTDEQTRILRSLEGLASPIVEDVLLAADFRIKLQLGDADRIYDETIARFGKGDTTTLLQLARWLNAHRQSERVLTLLPIERATENNQLIMVHLDALALLQRWSDIDKLLARSDLMFDPEVLESFRARSAQGQDSATDAEFHWNRALSAAGNDPFKLRFVANFAEQTRATAVALKAYEQLARFPEHAAFAYQGIERVGGKTGASATQRAAAEKLLALTPTDPNSTAQLLYLDLLLGSDVEANLAKANDLVKRFPARLAFRITAALGYLRQHDAGSALAQFSGPSNAPPIEWSKTPPSWRAVYAAALFANEQPEKAREIIATIPEGSLNAEEKTLIAPITEAK
jgi:tetratricopeptide (TPR) repeat protein